MSGCSWSALSGRRLPFATLRHRNLLNSAHLDSRMSPESTLSQQAPIALTESRGPNWLFMSTLAVPEVKHHEIVPISLNNWTNDVPDGRRRSYQHLILTRSGVGTTFALIQYLLLVDQFPASGLVCTFPRAHSAAELERWTRFLGPRRVEDHLAALGRSTSGKWPSRWDAFFEQWSSLHGEKSGRF